MKVKRDKEGAVEHMRSGRSFYFLFGWEACEHA